MTRAVFLGTPAAAVPSLASLASVADVVTVITRPDAAAGRSRRKTPTPVKVAAREFGFAVQTPSGHSALRDVVEAARPDVGIVVAYGRILRPDVLAVPRFGYLNVHFSLLPRWRGAAPVERAILAGDPVSGVSLIRLDEGLDTGPVLGELEIALDGSETGGSLTADLAGRGAGLVADLLPAYVQGRIHPAEQLDAGATVARRLTTDDARIDPDDSSEHIARAVRAFHPRPGAWLMVEGSRLGVVSAEPVPEQPRPGHIEFPGGMPVLGVAGGGVALTRVQPEGKAIQEGPAWGNGRRREPAVLDSAG